MSDSNRCSLRHNLARRPDAIEEEVILNYLQSRVDRSTAIVLSGGARATAWTASTSAAALLQEPLYSDRGRSESVSGS